MAVRLTAYVYATFYSALDVVSGIAAGYVTRELGPGVPRPDEVRLLFRIGTPLGEIGSVALLACTALLVVDRVLRRELPAAAVALLLVAGRGWCTWVTSSRPPAWPARPCSAWPPPVSSLLTGRRPVSDKPHVQAVTNR